jgi:hypothetical protein
VFTEATFSHIIARKTIREKFSGEISQPDKAPLKYGELLNFNWPLTASNLIFLIARPLVSAALARGLHPIDDLTAWPVLSSFLFLTRSPAAALPEVVIGLYEEEKEKNSLCTFSLVVGFVLSALLTMITFTRLGQIYFEDIIDLTPHLADVATSGLIVALALPTIFAYLYYLRGKMTAQRKTLPITIAMVVELVVMAIVLVIGIGMNLPGVPLASASLSLGMGADILALLVFSKRSKKEIIHKKI